MQHGGTTIEVRGLDGVLAALRRLPQAVSRATYRAFDGIGERLTGEISDRYAPRSPDMQESSATLKRRKRTAARRTPGGLEKSVFYTPDEHQCAIYVPSNSYAGKYARRIHDERGVTWRDLGPGSVAKGARTGGKVGEKFIERAILDNEARIRATLGQEVGKELAKA